VFADRNFATGAALSMIVGFGSFSGMLWSPCSAEAARLRRVDVGLVLAPGGLGNIFSLFARIVTRVDQRMMLGFGCLLNAVSST